MLYVPGAAMYKRAVPVTFQLLGDISLDGLYCDPQNHAAFAENCAGVRRLLGSCDVRVANWESPLMGDGEVNVGKRIRLATTAAAAEAILPLELDVVTLANNHLYDCGTSGYLRTCAFLDSSGIGRVGAGLTLDAARQPLLLERRGMKFALLNYVGPETCPMLPDPCEVQLNVLDETRVLEDVRAWAPRVDHVIVSLHWGDRDVIEYPSLTMRSLGRRLVEAGARVVFGGQIHVLLGWERWQGGAILHSLGNYCFSPVGISTGDAYRALHPLTRQGAVACLAFEKDRLADLRWRYLRQAERSLMVEDDRRPARRRRHEAQAAALALSDRDYFRKYRSNVRKWTVRQYLARRGFLGAVAGVRPKDVVWLFRRAFRLGLRW